MDKFDHLLQKGLEVLLEETRIPRAIGFDIPRPDESGALNDLNSAQNKAIVAITADRKDSKKCYFNVGVRRIGDDRQYINYLFNGLPSESESYIRDALQSGMDEIRAAILGLEKSTDDYYSQR